MRHAILLAATAVIVAACGAPERIAGPAVAPGGLADGRDPLALRNTSDLAPWTAYRTFDFNSATEDVSPSDMPKVYEIVDYLRKNPSLDVAIDGTLGSRSVSEADRILGNRRAASVRRALMDAGAGIASYKIFSGSFANPERKRAGQVQVLIGPRTGSSNAASQSTDPAQRSATRSLSFAE